MQNNGILSNSTGYSLILLLFVFWACSSPAPVQDSHSNTTPPSGNTNNAEKTSDLSPGEGLWLVSQLSDSTTQIQQAIAQLSIPADSIYHPNNNSLGNTVLKIKGTDNSSGTGAFISKQGLILTNFRTALSGIANASKPRQNHLQNGFFSETTEQEIPLQGYTIYIPVEQKDITNKINQHLSDTLSYSERKKQSQQIKKQFIAQRKADNQNLVAEIDDAWSGNRQIMSVYKKIEDVRLVYAPPKSAAFPSQGGYKQTWPSYSADYTFLRAYADSNGKRRSYDQANIPYQPKNHLQIDASGVEPTDQTIALGYPDKTQRQESSYAIKFYQKHQFPVLIDSYKALLNATQLAARVDSTTSLNNAPQQMVATQNLTYFTQLQSSFKSDNTANQRIETEQQFKKWIEADSLRTAKFRRVLPQLDQAYRIASQNGNLLFALVQTLNNSKLLQIAGLYNSYYQHINDSTNAELGRVDKYKLINQHQSVLSETNIEAETQFLGDMLYTLSTLPEGNVVFHLMELFKRSQGDALRNEIRSYLKKQQEQSIIFDPERAKTFLTLSADSVRNRPPDKMITLYQELLNSYQFSRQNYSQHVPYLEPAQELYVKGMMEFQNAFPYPDANGTLRLSVGSVKEFQPKKETTQPALSASNNQVVNFITTNDITGGGYGSPVLNNKGKLIGLASYRTPEGIASDFVYNHQLHRTINVDIRYILSLLSEFSSNQRLFEEMNISKE